jgi:predicted metal-binding membrane protein
MWPIVRDERLFLGTITGLIALAWINLWVWQESPYGRFLSHEENEGIAVLGDEYLMVVLLFVVGWTLMTVAMMLPTSLPLVAFFRALVRKREDGLVLVLLLVIGYVAVWTAFAVAVHVGDLGLHEAAERIGWLETNAWVIGAGTLLLAGLYQFSPLKYKCLDKCRSPMSFVMSHWGGGHESRRAFGLGVHHGLYCLGCCWSLMLLMFAVGVGNIGWMLVLGTVMAVEKNMPWGRRLSAPLGVALLAWGIAVVLLDAPGLGPS